jgi:site-specific DNA-methyltransferase (adenine-specific)
MAMFPPALASELISRFGRRGRVFADPFAGRGTATVEAIRCGMTALAVDINPVAVALNRAKLAFPPQERVDARVDELAQTYEYDQERPWQAPETVRIFYHWRTLDEILYLRSQLRPDRSRTDAFLQGVLLGALHGTWTKKRQPRSYLSVHTSNTFSMSPNCMRTYMKRMGIRAKRAPTFQVLSRRIGSIYAGGRLTGDGAAYLGDSTRLPAFVPRKWENSVSLVVTSPPYLGVISYGRHNWLRLWYLGHDYRQVEKAARGSKNIDRYMLFMNLFGKSLLYLLKRRATVVLVLGDVNAGHSCDPVPLGSLVAETWCKDLGYDLLDSYLDAFEPHSKVSRLWGANRGRATERDRILVFQAP